MKIEIGNKTFEIEKLSGYRLLKVLGDGSKDIADTYRDLILACVKNPEMTKEEVENLEPVVFFKLGAEIIKLHNPDLKNLEDLKNLNKK